MKLRFTKMQGLGNDFLLVRGCVPDKDGEERAVKIADGKAKDGTTVSFIDRILDGQKTGETRPTKGSIKPNAWVGIYKDGKVYGRVKFGEPKWITKQSAEYRTSYIEEPNYDIDDSVGGKWYYPVLEVQDFRDNPIPTNRAGQWGAAYELPQNVRYSVKDTPPKASKRNYSMEEFEVLYRENGRILSDALRSAGLWFTGGRNAPYLWLMCPDGMSGRAFFSRLLEQTQIVGTPGEGFGPSGAGYLRLSCFASRGDTEEAARRLMKVLQIF